MKEHAKPPFSYYKHTVYRNFATLAPAQNLMDDLVSSREAQNILGKLYYDSGTSQHKSATERVMQKSEREIIQSEINSKFKPQNWYATRFSDGTWPVLYCAESEGTALQEVIYHLKKFYLEELQSHSLTLDRRVIKLRLLTNKAVDLNLQPRLKKDLLTSKESDGYPYCQTLAKGFREKGATLLRAPSARDPKGQCLAILDRSVIAKDEGHLKYLKLVLSADDVICFEEKTKCT